MTKMHVLAFILASVSLLAAANADDTADHKRQADMAKHKAYLEERLHAVPKSLPSLQKKLKEIDNNYGISGLGYMFRKGEDLNSVIGNQPLHPDAIKTLIVFSQELKKRGTDLIVMPVPNQVVTHAHRLQDDIPADANVWPAYTKGLIELIENDVEVIDLTEAFATHTGKGDMLRRADHHWGSAGMAKAAEIAAKRLDRYPHLQKHRDRKEKDFIAKEKQIGLSTSIFSFNKMWSSRKKKGIRDTYGEVFAMTQLPKTEPAISIKYTGKLPLGQTRKQIKRSNKLNKDILIGGDSMCFHQCGSPFPMHLSRELGMPISDYGQSGGASRYAKLYAETLSSYANQPKVLLMIFRVAPMTASEGTRKWIVPKWPKLDNPADKLQSYAGKLEVEFIKVTKKPNPDTAEYDDAIATASAKITKGPHQGKTIVLYRWCLRKRTPDQTFGTWKTGVKTTVNVMPQAAAYKKDANLTSIMELDEINSFTLPRFWVKP